MKQIMIEYIPDLSTFLNENGIEWAFVDNNRILINYMFTSDLFLLGMEFSKWETNRKLLALYQS